MDIIARFPRLPPADEPAPHRDSAERRTRHDGPPRRGPGFAAGASAHRSPAFPTVSVVTLAAVAAVAWSLAAWHESVRLASQRRPERLALQPASAAQPDTPTRSP